MSFSSDETKNMCEKYKHWYEGITLTVKFILRGDNNPISTKIAGLTLKRPLLSKVSERGSPISNSPQSPFLLVIISNLLSKGDIWGWYILAIEMADVAGSRQYYAGPESGDSSEETPGTKKMVLDEAQVSATIPMTALMQPLIFSRTLMQVSAKYILNMLQTYVTN